MKRSEINAAIKDCMELFKTNQIYLPDFAYWTPEEWPNKGHEIDEIRKLQLGWDVTDFGKNNFADYGLVVITLRNGYMDDTVGKSYCEKIMVVKENQKTPYHYHKYKYEDIINRGGGNLVVQMYNAGDEEYFLNTPVMVYCDGIKHEFPAGHKLTLKPGQSVTLDAYNNHQFWGEEGKGTVIVGEVSKVNDDANDNFFAGGLPRFPVLEEDEAPFILMCTEYPAAS